jgi:hypothetical protein
VSRARFTPKQRRVLVLLGMAVVIVFGLLGYSVATNWPRISSPTPSGYIPPTLSALTPSTPGSPLATPAPPITATTSPIPSPTPTPTPVPLSQIDSARVVNELSQIVAGVRNLPAVEQVPVSFPTQLEVTIGLLQRYEEEQPWQQLSLYTTLGLIPPLDPPPQPDVVAQTAHISSLYLPEQREILLVTGRGATTSEEELAVVHALARATQDQQFDLATLAPCQSTTDAQMALKALVEGDPILVTALYADADVEGGNLNQFADMAANIEEPTYAQLEENPAFQRIRHFPYREGARLVATLYGEREWRTVDRAYAHPPCSTEHILHPDRYVAEEPVEGVALSDLGPTLGEEWALVERDTLGELLIGLHLATYVSDEGTAWSAADGWAGDTVVRWQSETDEELVAWRIAWDHRDDAEAFERAYTLLVPRFRVPALVTADTPFDLPGQLWSGPAGAAYLGRVGRVVTVVWGPDPETVTSVAEALP